MREISGYKKKKVIELFLSGFTYDEIVKELGIAKGPVVNIIDDFREGRLALPLEFAGYVDLLRKVAVDLRKSNININQLMYLLELEKKIRSMGVEVGEIGDWLDVCKEMASPVSDIEFKDAALELSRLRQETGMGYSELLVAYMSKQELMEAVKQAEKVRDAIKNQAKVVHTGDWEQAEKDYREARYIHPDV